MWQPRRARGVDASVGKPRTLLGLFEDREGLHRDDRVRSLRARAAPVDQGAAVDWFGRGSIELALGGKAAVRQALCREHFESLSATGISQVARLAEYLQSKQDVVVPVARIVQAKEITGHNRA